MINFKSAPFLKILVPYLAGIVCVLVTGIMPRLHLTVGLSFGVLLVTFLFQKYHKPANAFKKVIYTVCVNVFLFLLAFETSYFYNAQNDINHYTHYVELKEQEFFCTVNDLPVTTEKFIKLPVTINAVKTNSTWHYTTGSSLIYLKSPVTQKIVIGNTLYINSKFGYINPPQNPDEFNYRAFLEDRNIFNTVYADASQLYKVNFPDAGFSFATLGTRIKAHVVDVLRHSGLSQEAFSICAALLVGYDDEISGDVMTSFSHSGTLHVLSVSGMHTGILYIVLLFIFELFDKHNRYKKLKCLFIIAALFLFVLITGFSPSVLRASLMLALVILGKTFYRNGNSYNTLLLSAFLLLLYDPLLIKDVGFLLSYFAVFGIMYLYPILNTIYFVKNSVLRWFWNLSLMSVAATLFTLPVSLYYFHQFPVWFIFSNMLIIPISTALMALSFLLLVFYKIIFIKHALAVCINFSTSAMLWFTQLTDDKMYGFVDYISFSKTDLVFSCFIIIVFLHIISTKSYRALLTGICGLILWAGLSCFTNYKELKEKELLVFSVKRKSAYLLRIGHTVYVHTDSLSEKEFQRNIKPYLLNYSGLTIIYDHSDLFKHANMRVLNVQKPYADLTAGKADYIIVSNNSPLVLKSGNQIKPLVIADCSNNYTFVKKLKKQCSELEIPFYSIKDKGPFKIKF